MLGFFSKNEMWRVHYQAQFRIIWDREKSFACEIYYIENIKNETQKRSSGFLPMLNTHETYNCEYK